MALVMGIMGLRVATLVADAGMADRTAAQAEYAEQNNSGYRLFHQIVPPIGAGRLGDRASLTQQRWQSTRTASVPMAKRDELGRQVSTSEGVGLCDKNT